MHQGLRPVDEVVLALLGTHEVLTSGQLVRLTGLPERTVQHHLGLLYRAGLINRVRPPREVGTSPYHCWLTAFGAAAIGDEKPGARSDDLAGVQASAALSELWLAVRDRGKGVGLELRGWRRLPSGPPYQDPHTGTIRELPAEAEMIVIPGPPGGREMRLLVVARTERVPAARLAAVLARFACFLAASSDPSDPVLTVLARMSRVAERVLTTADTLGEAPAARRLEEGVIATARHRVAVGVVEPHPVGLATEPVWATPADRRPRRLIDILAECARSAK